MIRWISCLFVFLLISGTLYAQDGLDLPTELYVLTNSGEVHQYGLGAAGVSVVTPEGEFILDFGIAPDGNWMAYRTEAGLTVYNIYDQSSELAEGVLAGIPPFRGRGDTIAWSPDGDAIVYTTDYGARVYYTTSKTFGDLRQGAFEQVIWSAGGDYLAAGAEDNIWWLYRREGDTLVLTSAVPSSLGLAWVSPSEIAFAPATGGLFRMNLAQANTQTLLLDDSWIYQLPFLLGDGRLGVFGRQKNDAEIPEGSGTLIALAPDSPEVQTLGEAAVDLNNLRWAPKGQLMIALRGGVLALVGPANGAGFTLPVADAVAYTWGPTALERVGGVEFSADITFITQDANDIAQVWRLPGDGSAAVLLTAAEADVIAYALAPNGRDLAYVSGGQVWLQSGDNAAESIADLEGREARNMAFSPDGTRIALDVLSTFEDPVGGIWLANADGSPAEQILQNGDSPDGTLQYIPPFYFRPQFAPNINALLLMVGGGESVDYSIYDLSSGEQTPIGGFDEAIWLRDGRILAYGNGVGIGDPPPTQPIMVVNPADLSRQELVSLPYPARVLSMREVEAGKVRVVIGSYQRGPRSLTVLDLDVTTGAMTPFSSGGFMTNPLLSPDGAWAAGLTHLDGQLTFRNLESGEQVVLAEPPRLNTFQWASQR